MISKSLCILFWCSEFCVDCLRDSGSDSHLSIEWDYLKGIKASWVKPSSHLFKTDMLYVSTVYMLIWPLSRSQIRINRSTIVSFEVSRLPFAPYTEWMQCCQLIVLCHRLTEPFAHLGFSPFDCLSCVMLGCLKSWKLTEFVCVGGIPSRTCQRRKSIPSWKDWFQSQSWFQSCAMRWS